MRHTCDTDRSGSEKGNTCAACHRERIRQSIPTGYGNLLAEWLKQTTPKTKRESST